MNYDKAALSDIVGLSENRLPDDLDLVSAELDIPIQISLLSYIYNYAGVIPPKNLEEDLSNWDLVHLPHLALNLDMLTRNGAHSGKLAYLLGGGSKNENTSFVSYNECVDRDLRKIGINLEAWHSHHIAHSFAGFSNANTLIEVSHWSRDFKRDFAIGNVSECCIALDGSDEHYRHVPVLLDYFIDHSIQVANIRLGVGDDLVPIGQVYFVALKSTTDVPILGVTSVELRPPFRSMSALAPAIMNSIAGPGGFSEEYGFANLLLSERFQPLTGYLKQKKEQICLFNSSVLKQRVQNLNQLRKQRKRSQQSTVDIFEKLNALASESRTLMDLKDRLYAVQTLTARKAGLNDAVSSGETYLGTNYLDLVGAARRLPFFSMYGEEGFFRQKSTSLRVSGYWIEETDYMGKLETFIKALDYKYKRGASI